MYKKELIFPEGIKVEKETPTYGKFMLAPLERGFGVSIGNALRRILHSYIQGSAIFAVRIDGVPHEFSTLKGVLEDVPQIILNLKRVRLKTIPAPTNHYVMPLSSQGKGEILAKEFRPPAEVEIQNPDQKIATLTTKSAKLALEAYVMRGRGFLPLEELKQVVIDRRMFPHDTIFIDADFSPVRRANFIVENIRVEHRTDYEKLLLEVETDGSISPLDALMEANEILRRHIDTIARTKEQGVPVETVRETAEPSKSPLLEDIRTLNLPKNVENILLREEILTLKDIVSFSEKDLKRIKGLGDATVKKVKEALKKKKLSLESNTKEREQNAAQKKGKKTGKTKRAS